MKRSTYYTLKQDRAEKYRTEKKAIKDIFDYHKGRYGYRRVTAELRQKGFCLNHKTVRKLMVCQGLRSLVRPKKYRSYTGVAGKAAENLLKRNFTADRFNQKWVTDVTEFSVCGKKYYLSALMDLYNREIISSAVSDRPSLDFVCTMLRQAFIKYKPLKGLIVHSDQGWHYRTDAYARILSENGAVQSMSRKGTCLDNAVIENFFGMMKTEWFYLSKYNSAEAFRKDLDEYINYYNNERIKSSLNGMSPAKFRLTSAA